MKERGARRREGVAVVCALAVVLGSARGEACENGAKFARDCRLHLYTGPVLAPARVLGLGGAYEGIAEGLSGYAVSAAAPAVRTAWSTTWFDYDLDASISIPTPFRKVNDLEFNGLREAFDYRGFVYFALGANVQLGAWGFGVTTELQRFDLTKEAQTGSEKNQASLGKTRLLVGRSFLGGDLVVGLGLRRVAFGVTATTADGQVRPLVDSIGWAPEIGALIRPLSGRFRAGLTFRAAVTSSPGATDVPVVDRWIVPEATHLPWELEFGFAVQAGPRPLNVDLADPTRARDVLARQIETARLVRKNDRAAILAATPEDRRVARAKELDADEAILRKREDAELARFSATEEARRDEYFRALPRDHALVTLGMLITGPTERGVSIESFFSQSVARAGAVVTYSPRAGLETEVVPGLFKVRVGTYIEPSQFEEVPNFRAFRQHVTMGFDLSLFRWAAFGLANPQTKWRITPALDITRGYWNYGFSFGAWR
ncbi:MAG: hypothetical protein IPJ34_43455 [Myxococcales bacterium]|nr:hypothetical protein [Myxococcales bacterium]